MRLPSAPSAPASSPRGSSGVGAECSPTPWTLAGAAGASSTSSAGGPAGGASPAGARSTGPLRQHRKEAGPSSRSGENSCRLPWPSIRRGAEGRRAGSRTGGRMGTQPQPPWASSSSAGRSTTCTCWTHAGGGPGFRGRSACTSASLSSLGGGRETSSGWTSASGEVEAGEGWESASTGGVGRSPSTRPGAMAAVPVPSETSWPPPSVRSKCEAPSSASPPLRRGTQPPSSGSPMAARSSSQVRGW
mmetsp:Transcript_55145/g.171328  ORF Transcript_55145/g.171328 Transcript_55145/m.171328 type:complete len:246 (-) Transcript_55145:270-1007(-)